MRKLVLAVGLVLMASGAQAVTLNVIGGQLHGASGVLVDGSYYDVEFLDGTCIDLYNGCDEASDFTFQTQASAVLASQALLDQVFLDGVEGQFDSFPDLTSGCPPLILACWRYTPWCSDVGGASPPGVCVLHATVAYNDEGSPDEFGDPGSTIITFGIGHVGFSTVLENPHHFALWSASAIPEPSTALLLGLGLTGLAAKGRRRS